MLVPTPLSEEHFRGQIGRVGLLNSFHDSQETTWRVRRIGGDVAEQGVIERTASVLARLSNLSVGEYIRRHTLIPYQSFYHRTHWSHVGGRWPFTTLGSSSNNVARYCELCTADDIELHGFSYWRRGHQLPGMMWCLRHKIPLRQHQRKHAFDILPQNAKGSAVTDLGFDTASSVIHRFLRISELLLEIQQPIEESAFKPRLVKMALARKLRTGLTGSNPPPSDIVVNTCSESWLASVFPGIEGKRRNEFFVAIDAATRSSPANSATASFAIVLSIFFDDASEAVKWLFDDSPGQDSR